MVAVTVGCLIVAVIVEAFLMAGFKIVLLELVTIVGFGLTGIVACIAAAAADGLSFLTG